MNQEAYQEITKMVNAFPQSAANLKALLLTYDEDTTGIPDKAIIEASQRFRRNLVKGQSGTFAPSIAEFVSEARRIAEILPHRDRQALARPSHRPFVYDDKPTRIRMGFKMAVLSAAIGMGKADDVAAANADGLDEMIALAQQWGVPVPEELWAQRGKAA